MKENVRTEQQIANLIIDKHISKLQEQPNNNLQRKFRSGTQSYWSWEYLYAIVKINFIKS